MKRKKIIIISVVTILAGFLIFIGYYYYRVLTAEIVVIVKPNTTIEVNKKIHVSDLITSINGKLLKDELVDTSKIGKKEVNFTFINDDNIKVDYRFYIMIEDTTPPIIGVPNSYTVTKGYDDDLSKKFFCGDNYDDTPSCKIEGEYDTNTVGSYQLTYVAKDKSNNEITKNFTLYVQDPPKNSSNNNYYEIETIDFNKIKKEHKDENTKVGIDVSRWQGDINFSEVKKSGVEFVMIRLGSEDSEGEFFIDPKFEQNIKGFNEVQIPVGIYYYSYADSIKKAKKEAKWVVDQLKKYKIDLPVVYDWENWSSYQDYKLSFHSLSEVANTFLSIIKKAGYEPMLYSSKYYLENIWEKSNYKVWLAHYTTNTNYTGNYYMWQLCNNGKVSGIEDNVVDINILYEKK